MTKDRNPSEIHFGFLNPCCNHKNCHQVCLLCVCLRCRLDVVAPWSVGCHGKTCPLVWLLVKRTQQSWFSSCRHWRSEQNGGPPTKNLWMPAKRPKQTSPRIFKAWGSLWIVPFFVYPASAQQKCFYLLLFCKILSVVHSLGKLFFSDNNNQ